METCFSWVQVLINTFLLGKEMNFLCYLFGSDTRAAADTLQAAPSADELLLAWTAVLFFKVPFPPH